MTGFSKVRVLTPEVAALAAVLSEAAESGQIVRVRWNEGLEVQVGDGPWSAITGDREFSLEPTRTELVSLRVSEADRAVLVMVAAATGVSVSEFVRSAALDAARVAVG